MTGRSEWAVLEAGQDFTARWSFRRDDYLLWLRVNDPLPGETQFSIVDLWQLRDGDWATITNRSADIPSWFELHPTEVANANAHAMLARLRAGYVPGGVVDGPNIWKVRAGDRLAWVGSPRDGLQGTDGVLSILVCRDCLLVVGEAAAGGELLPFFGAPQSDAPSQEAKHRMKAAVAAVNALGAPRELATEWLLG